MPGRNILVALLLALSSATTSEGSGRKQLWDVDLSKLIGQAGESDAAYVWGIAFSPDETQLAIGFNHLGDARASHVILVAVDHPKSVLRRIDPEAARGLELFRRNSIQWSPSGKLLAVYGGVLSLEGAPPCLAPTEFEFKGFLAKDRIVFAKRGLAAETQVRRPDCSVEEVQHIANGFSFVWGTCPQAGLIAMENIPDWPKVKTVEIHVVKYPSYTTTQHWTWDGNAVLGGVILADSCQAICSGEGHTKDDRSSFHTACWSVGTGKKILDNPRLTRTDKEAFDGSGGPMLAATASHWDCLVGRVWQYLDMDGCASRTTRTVLWNIETGEETASWPRQEQQFKFLERKGSDVFALTLSPKGKYLAEGGAGRVRLYTLR